MIHHVTYNGVEVFSPQKGVPGDCECDLIWQYVVIKAILNQGEAEACPSPSQPVTACHSPSQPSVTEEGVGKGVKEARHPERNPRDTKKAIRVI